MLLRIALVRVSTVPYGIVPYSFLGAIRYFNFLYNLSTVDRGFRKLLATHHNCPYLISTQLANKYNQERKACINTINKYNKANKR